MKKYLAFDVGGTSVNYAFVNEEWHRFIKFSSPIVFQQELDFINKIFNEVIEVKNLQNNINEE